MDTFVFLVAVLVIMLGVEAGQVWIALAALAIVVVTTRSLAYILLSLLATGAFYGLKVMNLSDYGAAVLIAVVLLALALGGKGGAPGTEEYYYKITYTAGYITQPQDDAAVGTRSLPYDLEDACIQYCAQRYRTKGRDKSIKQEKLLSASVTYENSSGDGSDIPATIRAMIDHYKRVVI